MELTPDLVQERARQVFELFELGLEMKRSQLRRSHPKASDEEVERLLKEWLQHRPGAEDGDAGPEGFRLRHWAP